MSKKIKINIPNKVRPNLSALFHAYIVRKFSEKKKSSYYDDMDDLFPGWGYTDDYDDYELMYPTNCVPLYGKRSGSKLRNWIQGVSNVKDKKVKKGKGKKSFNYDDIYDDYGEYGEYVNVEKEIWFYPDYHDKEDRLEFNTLKDFSDYCDREGYYVSSEVEGDILWRYESHCCIKKDKSGLMEVISEHSYGEMFYEACDAKELSEYYHES